MKILHEEKNIFFKDLKPVLLKFENAGMNGHWECGDWKVANGCNNVWMNLYYQKRLIVSVIDGEIKLNCNLDSSTIKVLVSKIKEVFSDFNMF